MVYDYKYLYLMNKDQLRTVYRNTLNDLRTEFSLSDEHGQMMFPDEDPHFSLDIRLSIMNLDKIREEMLEAIA